MKVISIEPTCSEYVRTDEDGYSLYRRHSADHWEILMGDSWESYYPPRDVEAAYQFALAAKS